MRKLIAVLVCALTLPLAAQHDHGSLLGTTLNNSSTRGPLVHFKSGNETISAELFLGMGKQRAASPVLILIPEWWGLNDQIRNQARQLAAAGYSVLTLDVYRGQSATTMEEAHELSRALPHDRAVRDLEGAFNYLKTTAGPTSKIGVIGWCMGGGIALEFAVAEPNLNAVVVNYGAMPTDTATLDKIKAPILGNFGGLDKGITKEMVSNFQESMETLGKPVDLKIYPDAGHAFMNEENKTGYNAADAADAKRRTLLFLNAQLKH